MRQTIKRSRKSIYKQVQIQKIRKNEYWTEKEDLFLMENYPQNGSDYCAEILGRSNVAINARASLLNIKNITRAGDYTQEENAFLIENYFSKGVKYCAIHLNRSTYSIKEKAGKLKLKTNYKRPLKENSSKANKRMLERFKTEPVFHISMKARRAICKALRKSRCGQRKADRTINLLNMSFIEYQKFLTSKMTPQMNWDLLIKGEIEIHHIKPIYLFQKMDATEQYEAFNYLNTEPLWENNETARKYGDFVSEGHDERHSRIDPILKATLPPHHPIVSASLPSQPEPSGDVPAFPFQKASEDRP